MAVHEWQHWLALEPWRACVCVCGPVQSFIISCTAFWLRRLAPGAGLAVQLPSAACLFARLLAVRPFRVSASMHACMHTQYAVTPQQQLLVLSACAFRLALATDPRTYLHTAWPGPLGPAITRLPFLLLLHGLWPAMHQPGRRYACHAWRVARIARWKHAVEFVRMSCCRWVTAGGCCALHTFQQCFSALPCLCALLLAVCKS